jgi:hypothetical protein
VTPGWREAASPALVFSDGACCAQAARVRTPITPSIDLKAHCIMVNLRSSFRTMAWPAVRRENLLTQDM